MCPESCVLYQSLVFYSTLDKEAAQEVIWVVYMGHEQGPMHA